MLTFFVDQKCGYHQNWYIIAHNYRILPVSFLIGFMGLVYLPT